MLAADLISSEAAAVLWLIAAGIVLGRVGIGPISGSVPRWGTWALVVLLTVGAVMNAASPSRWERFGWGPSTALLAVLCIVVARSASRPQPQAGGSRDRTLAVGCETRRVTESTGRP